ncbi:MAG: response regulator [Spirochaetes bacterium]|nr:response regulator [Spirochaetota bacterium]
MKILVAIGNAKYAEYFMMSLLPKGYEVYIVEKHASFFDIAREKHPDLIVFDSDVPEYRGLDGLRDLREDKTIPDVQVIVFSKQSGLDFVKATMKLGVVGFIYKPISGKELEIKMDHLLTTVHSGDNQRRYVRIKPRPFDNAKIELFIPGSESISGDIKDISLGGMAVQLINFDRINEITKGKMYDRIKMSLDNEEIFLPAEAVLVKGGIIAFKFKDIAEVELKTMCYYIHDKLIHYKGDDPIAPYMKKV